VKRVLLIVGTGLRADAPRTVGILLEPLSALDLALVALFLRELVNAAASHDSPGVIGAVVGLVATQTLGYAIGFAGAAMRITLTEKTGFAFDTRLARALAGFSLAEDREDPVLLERIELLTRERGVLGGSLNTVCNTLTVLIGSLGTMAVLAVGSPVLLCLVVFALPAMAAARAAERRRASAEAASAAGMRQATRLRALMRTRGFGQEARVFDLGPLMRRRAADASSAAWQRRIRAESQAGVLQAGGKLAFGLGYVGAVLFTLWRVSHGAASPGDVVLAVVIGQQVQTRVVAPLSGLRGLGQTLRAAQRLLWLEDRARTCRDRLRGGEHIPARLVHGIELRNVGYTYPGATAPALRDVSILVKPGTVVAVVGENGAGKSSLVRMLTRMSDPSQGSILADGVDLRAFDPADWHRAVTAARQDFERFAFSVSLNVGVGDLPRAGDTAGIEAALAAAGATDLAAGLPDGLDTVLGSESHAGRELSGGQWHKLALARALMRPSPLVAVYDEPAASLDAHAEHELFERFMNRAASATSQGTITVLVTHRFSTVRGADLILVLDRGRLVASGTHADLMAAGGLYADLFEMQAASHAAGRGGY
jgi:ATP-binding cassette subfamily B protein